ncbi:MAG: DUF4340 domain-containing protein [Huintestinicola sp.]
MRSKFKFLIAGAVVLLLLVGAVLALVLTDSSDDTPDEEITTTAAETQSRLLYEKDPSTILDINVTNSSGEYDIIKYTEDSWVILEFYGQPLNVSNLNTALDSATTVTAQQIVAENVSDLSIYGLTDPRAKVTVSFGNDDGTNITEKKLVIGDDTPVSGTTYMCFDGENTVYTVNTSDIKCFLEDKYYYVSKTVYIAKTAADEEDTTDYTKINSITISRKDIDYDIVVEYDERQDSDEIVTGNSSTHVLSSPVKLDLNPDLCDSVLNNVFGLTADHIEKMSPTEADLAEYGLDDPFGTVDFDIVGGPLKLYIGDPYKDDDGKQAGYYCMAEGIDIVYAFTNDSIPWATVMPLDITMTMITSTYIYSIDSIDVSCGGENTHFELNKDSDNFAVTCDDPDVTADNFKSFYQFILRAPAEELYLDECTEPANITLTIKNDYGTDVIEFIESTDRMSVIRLNGVTSFRCRTAYTARLIENLEHLLNNEEIIDTW